MLYRSQVEPNNSILESEKGHVNFQQSSGRIEHHMLYRPSEEEVESQTVLYHNQCSKLDGEIHNDRYVQNDTSQYRTSSLTSHRYTDKALHNIHSSNISLSISKSVAGSRRSHTPKSCRSNVNNVESYNTSILSEGVVCRICHEGDASEVLVSPCYCSGSMGLLHVSCLQTWLGSSNKTTCEICNFQFSLTRKTMPVTQFLKNPGTAQDKRNIICDVISMLIVTPLTVIVVWICLQVAEDHFYVSKLAKIGLICLSVLLLLLYVILLTVALRQNWKLWKDWKMFHQEVTLLCEPTSVSNKSDKKENLGARSKQNSHSTLGDVQLQSVKINIQGSLKQYKRKKEKQNCKLSKHSFTENKAGLDELNKHGHTKHPHNHQHSRLEARCQDPSKQLKVHRNHGYNHYDEGPTMCMPQSPRKSRKKYVVETKNSCKSSNKSSSDQSSLNIVYENHKHDGYRQWTGYRPSHHDNCGKYLYNCDKRSDTEKSTGSYHTGGEYTINRSRHAYHNPMYEFQSKRYDNNLPKRHRYRPGRDIHCTSMDIFSRGGSPSEDNPDNYIAKWVNEQTNKTVCDRNNLGSRNVVDPIPHDKKRSNTNYDLYDPACRGRNSSQIENSKYSRMGMKDKFSVNSSCIGAASVVQEMSDFTQTDESMHKNISETNLNSSTAIELPTKDYKPNSPGTDAKSGPNDPTAIELPTKDYKPNSPGTYDKSGPNDPTTIELPTQNYKPNSQGTDVKSGNTSSVGSNNKSPDSKQIVESSSQCNSIHTQRNTDSDKSL